jgi:hypothetical protein
VRILVHQPLVEGGHSCEYGTSSAQLRSAPLLSFGSPLSAPMAPCTGWLISDPKGSLPLAESTICHHLSTFRSLSASAPVSLV